MANKDLKTRTPFSNSLETERLVKLKELSKSTQVPLSRLLDNAVDLLLASYDKTIK